MLGQLNNLKIISCEIVKRKYTELSIRANIYLSIFNIGSVLHWVNYSIKVSVEWHTATYDIVLLVLFNWLEMILQTTF